LTRTCRQGDGINYEVVDKILDAVRARKAGQIVVE
jgi:hypothetical protein